MFVFHPQHRLVTPLETVTQPLSTLHLGKHQEWLPKPSQFLLCYLSPGGQATLHLCSFTDNVYYYILP